MLQTQETTVESRPPNRVTDRYFLILQFGHGARTCIGKNISIMEMGKFIPQVLQTFDIEWASEHEAWKTKAAWFWKQTDMHVRFKVCQRV